MAQFLGRIRGQRGEETRLGSKVSGLMVEANGWNCGIRVNASHRGGRDVFEVYVTAGSAPGGRTRQLASVVDAPNGADVTIIQG